MFEKEKLSGNNFNDWFARLKLVLRVEKKMHVIEQPLPPAPEAGAEPNIETQSLKRSKCLKMKLIIKLGKPLRQYDHIGVAKTLAKSIKDYLKANGIVQQLTPPYTPQHNRVSERRNRTLFRYGIEQNTILNYGMEKFQTSVILYKDWGCEALYIKRERLTQLEQRSVKCIFIGYPKETMGYYFYFPLENKIVVARYAEFFEKRLISQEISGRVVELEEIQEEEDTTPSKITSNIPQEVEGFEPPQAEVIPIRRSERTHRAPNHLCLNVEVEEHSLGDLNEPTSYKVAMLDSESNKWIDAMNEEIQSMMDNMDMLSFVMEAQWIGRAPKQSTKTIAMSATESNTHSCVRTDMEAVSGLEYFISGHGIVPTIKEPLNSTSEISAVFIS
ncbi:retrotransposon protein, putative, ty1-copia subclass [Tanacetum coccineum]